MKVMLIQALIFLLALLSLAAGEKLASDVYIAAGLVLWALRRDE